MGVRKFMKRVGQSVEEADREKLMAFCGGLDVPNLDQVPLRTPVRLAGEVTSIRIVPRAGAPAVEATIRDGHGAVVAVFLGRGRVRGMTPGRRVKLQGVVLEEGNEHLVYNPTYELCP
ncbi:MAG: OB-fold nucleic acid binding domain-containing protein [Acidimicrobiia bacterium]|nr:OB-fold nucleic acid binding domain-containing protein [Acidimicrobiia bacterium]